MSVGSFFKKTLPNLAIGVASGVPGPIGMVAQLVGTTLGKKLNSDPAEINTAIEGATPDQIIALKQHDQDFQVTLQKLGFENVEDLAKITEQDRESARNLQIQTKGWTTPALAWTIIIGTFLIIISVLKGWTKVEAALAGTLVGYAVAMCQQVVGYYFGSSAGSDRKTDILANVSGSGTK